MTDKQNPDFLKVSAENKQQLAYQQLKNDILNNNYPEGTVLTERKLCEFYHVSRSPIRNAIQQLNHEGLLTLIPGKGVTVTGFSIEDILEVYDLIEVLQLYAIRTLSSRIDAYFLGFLQTALDKMKRYLDEGNYAKSKKWDQQFHQFLITASSNKRLASMYEQLEAQSLRFIATTTSDGALAQRSYQEHLTIYEYLKNHDLDGAEDGIRTHYKNIKQYYVDKLISRIQL